MIELRDVSKKFGDFSAVSRASFTLNSGEFLTILGPSGSGKTTLLRMIAGFVTPSDGEIVIHGQRVSQVPPHRRSIGMVFQSLALFPHMTAGQNVAYPLKMRRFDPATIDARVARYLDLVRLSGYADRPIQKLSGGQKQRVAIARALVFEPDLLLLDEPLGALDKKLREAMQLEFRRIQQELGVTTINVTHDQREALVMSDRVVVMNDGRIQQADDPVRIYQAPANNFVAAFIGETNFLPGRIESGALDGGTDVRIRVGEHVFRGRWHGPDGARPAGGCHAAIRAEQVHVLSAATADAELDSVVTGRIHERIFEGDRLVYVVQCHGLAVAVRAFQNNPEMDSMHAPGEAVRVAWRARDLLVFPEAGGDAHATSNAANREVPYEVDNAPS